MWGDVGNNRLDGRGGADKLHGRKGDDLYVVDNAADQVFEAKGEGNDRILTTVSYALAAGQSIETLSTRSSVDTANINLTGNELANSLWGDAGNNILDGGAAADKMYGRGGDDTYIVDNVQDRVIEAVGGGNDTVKTSVSFTLEAGQEIETLETSTPSSTTSINLTGNEFANTLVGNDGDNIIDGGGGADTMIESAGFDTYYIDNPGDRIVGNERSYTVTVLTTVSYEIPDGLKIRTFSAADIADTSPINLTGCANAGGLVGDILIGNDGDNILNGNGGMDSLTGNGGADTFVANQPDQSDNPQNTIGIGDFANSTNAVHDTLLLPHDYFPNFQTGPVNPDDFYAGDDPSKVPQGVELFFNTRTTTLYDMNYAFDGRPYPIAFFANGTTISAADIVVG